MQKSVQPEPCRTLMSLLHVHGPEFLLPIPPDDPRIICPDRPEGHEFLNAFAAEETDAAARDEAEHAAAREALLPPACPGWDRLLINTEGMVVWGVTEASRDEVIYGYPWLRETSTDITKGRQGVGVDGGLGQCVPPVVHGCGTGGQRAGAAVARLPRAVSQ